MTSTASQSTSNGPVILCIMDGWGLSHGHEHNAVALADTPNVDALFAAWPVSYTHLTLPTTPYV